MTKMINISEEAHRAIKIGAALQGKTLGDLASEVLLESMSEQEQQHARKKKA